MMLSISGCYEGEKLVFPKSDEVRSIKVTSYGFPDPKVENEISDRRHIENILKALESANNNWHRPVDTYPSNQYTIEIKNTLNGVMYLWLGANWLGSNPELANTKKQQLRRLDDKELVEIKRILGI